MSKKSFVSVLAILALLLPLTAVGALAGEQFCYTNDSKTPRTITSLTVYSSSPPGQGTNPQTQSLISSTVPSQELTVAGKDTVYWPTNFKAKSHKIKFKSNATAMMIGPLGELPLGGVALAAEDGVELTTYVFGSGVEVADIDDGTEYLVASGQVVGLDNVLVTDEKGELYTGMATIDARFSVGVPPSDDPDAVAIGVAAVALK